MRRSAVVIVLGDLARSPRMLNHAHALRREGWEVDLVGERETELPPALLGDEGVRVHAMPDPEDDGRGIPRAIRRVRARADAVTEALEGIGGRPSLVLLQSPPALPALPAAWRRAQTWDAKLVIDWHNFGWDLVRLRGGANVLAAPILRARELSWASRADGHLAVSREMATRLEDLGLSRVRPLPDHAARWLDWSPQPPTSDGGDRLPVVVCPMSWNDDDDLPLLASALSHLSIPAQGRPEPVARLVLTGTGPRKAEWAERLTRMEGLPFRVETPWIPTGDYAHFVASADLGLSLHRSASGVDFPMKVVEMRVAGLPVLTLDYGPALRARLSDSDGAFFTDGGGLARLLRALLLEADSGDRRREMREVATPWTGEAWQARWRSAVLDALQLG